jgi:Holliday junction resolvasome RuvABC ATP-dependent DNA helicase subunit
MKEYIGQSKIRPILELELKTGSLRSCLLYGASGIGKSALANALTGELKNTILHEYVASPSWDDEFIVDMLMDLSIEGYDSKGIPGPNAVKHTIYIDEVSELKSLAILRPMEDGHVYDKSGLPSWLPHINWIFSTNLPEKLTSAFLNRIKLQLHLTPYTVAEIGQIIAFNFPAMSKTLVEDIARRAKGIPRLCLSYAESVTLYNGDASKFFGLMGIDEEGLDERDRDYLAILADAKRPLSLNSLASALQETSAIVKMMESHLIFMKKICIGPSGRSIISQNSRGKRG